MSLNMTMSSQLLKWPPPHSPEANRAPLGSCGPGEFHHVLLTILQKLCDAVTSI